MNRIYKVIYSKARQCSMVVSELAKSSHKSSRKGADHVGTPALARMVAAVLAAGALTWGIVPGVSWAADTTTGDGNGVAIGTGSDAPKEENVAIGKGATISYSNGASSATGDIVVGNGANINNYASQGGSIAIGKNAKIENMAGVQESSFSWGQINPENVAGSIALGDNTYARTGSIMIGSHNYRGLIGDQTVDTSKTKDYGININATTLGTNSFNQGAFSSVTGAYSIISGKYNGSGFSSYGAQNFGATITGSLNSIESATSSSKYSGIANSIVGTANTTSNSNGSLIFGAGNTIKNSVTDITNKKFFGMDILDLSDTKSAKELQGKLMTAVRDNKSGGATLVIGGGNVADYTQKTQILGVNNTVTGTEKNISDYNMIDGFGNTINGASHLYTIGTNNKITNTKNTILAGDDYTNVSGLTDSVIIGNNRVRGKDDKAEFAYFSNQKNIVSIGNKNVLDSTDGSISIGNNNFMWRSGGQPEKYGYDTGNVAIGNNTYINSYLNQGDSIVIGKNATVINMGGSLEKAFAFGTPEGKDYSGSIAIGQNSYARSGSTMIGIHNYQGKLGDLEIDFTKDKSGGHSGIGEYQESIDATTIGNNSYNNGVFSTVVGSYTAVSGLYHNEKWGEKPYGVQNFGAAVLGSLNSVEGSTSTEHNTAGMADSILGSANRTKNANGTIMVGAGNVVEDSINDFDASEIKTKNGIASPNALSEAMRTSIKNANGGGAAAIVGNGNEVKKSTNVAVMGSKNSVTSTTNSQIFGDNRVVTGADGAPIDGAVIIGSAAAESPLTTDKKNVTILGYNANATAEGGVALGAGSVASREAQVAGYDPSTKEVSKDTSATWKATNAAVSVGKADGSMTRQITGVAAGTNATDAVNVAQLRAISSSINTDITASKTHFYSVNSTDAKAKNYDNKGATAANALAAGVGANADKASAVAIGDTAYAGSANGVAIGTGSWIRSSDGKPNANGGDVAIGQDSHVDSYVNQGGSIALGQNARVENMYGNTEKSWAFGQTEFGADNIPVNPGNEAGGVAIGRNSFARTGSLMVGSHMYKGAIADMDDVDGTDSQKLRENFNNINMTTLGTNSFNSGTFATVTGSYSATTAKKKTQNFAAAVAGSLNSIESYKDADDNSGVASSIVGTANRIANSNNTTILGAGNEVTNSLADIKAPKEGGASAKALQDTLKNTLQKDAKGAVVISGIGNKVDSSHGVSVLGSRNIVNATDNIQLFGDNREVTGATGSVIIGSADSKTTTSVKDATILGHNANVEKEGGVALGAGSVASREAQVAGYDPSTKDASTETSATWKATNAAVSVGKEDGSMTRQITGVAAGTELTDAVNVAQLQKAMAGAKDGNDTLKSSEDALKLDGNKLSMNIQDTAGHKVSGSVDLSKLAQAVDTNTTYTLTGQENKDNTTTITLEDNNGKKSSVTVATKDTRNTVKAGENVTLDTKDNDDGSHEYTVNVKADGKVEAGSTKIVSGDTVYNETRVKQDGTYVKVSNTAGENLSALDSQVTSNTQNINYLNGRVGELGDRINKAAAGSNALAALHPLDYDPDDKADFAVGYGHYRNANAAAVGAFYHPNENTMVNVGVSLGNGDPGFNAGVSFKIGSGSAGHQAMSKTEMAKVINSQSKEIDALKKDNADKDKRIDALEQKMAEILAKLDKNGK